MLEWPNLVLHPRKDQTQKRRQADDELQRQHFQQWDTFWGRPGFGAPTERGAQKENLMRNLHYPTAQKASNWYEYVVMSWKVKDLKFWTTDTTQQRDSRLSYTCKILFHHYGFHAAMISWRKLSSPITSFQWHKWPQTRMHTIYDTVFWYRMSCPFMWSDWFCSEC